MKEVARLIALAFVVFGVTATAVLLGNPHVGDAVGQWLGLVEARPPPAPEPERRAEEDTTIRVARPYPVNWVGLQGFPSQLVVRFLVPRDVPIIRGQLHLDIDSELIDQGDGLLRILVNGQERDAIVLSRGKQLYRLTYELTPGDLSTGSVVVTLDGNGTTNFGQICPTNVTNLGAAIEVLPSSSLLLELSAPLTGAAAVAVLLPDPLDLDVTDAPALAAWAAQWLSRQGVPTVLATPPATDLIRVAAEGPAPLSVDSARTLSLAGSAGVSEIAALRGAALPASYGQQWPLSVDALTTDLLTRTFRGSGRWSIKYKLADLPGGKTPGVFNLSLRTSRLQGDNMWTLRVLLNGSLVHSGNYAGNVDALSREIPLPQSLQGLTNEIVVTLVDNTPNQGICRAGPEAAAQLLPESRLLPAPSPADEKQALVGALAGADSVAVLDDSAGLAPAQYLDGMLGLILPLDKQVVFEATQGAARIEVLDAERIRALMAGGKPQSAREAFLVFPSSRSRPDGVGVIRLGEGGAASLPRSGGENALLVTW